MSHKVKFIMFCSILLISVGFSDNSIFNLPNSFNIHGVQGYSPHSTINIANDNELNSTFPGIGTESDPIRIEGFSITSTFGTLISIQDTTLYFTIRNNYLSGSNSAPFGIDLLRVKNGIIENNTVRDLINVGIRTRFSANNSVINNTMDNTLQGITIELSDNNTISKNIVTNSPAWAAIWFETSRYNTISENVVYDNLGHGIEIVRSSDNYVFNNTVFNNQWAGISFFDNTSANFIQNNTLYNNSWTGIRLTTSTNETVTGNTIYNNSLGMLIEESSNSLIAYNNISYSLGYGMRLANSPNNSLNNNIFIDDGLYIRGTVSQDYLQNSVSNNLVNGKPLVYLKNQNGGTVPDNAGQIIVFNSTDLVIKDRIISSVSPAIHTSYSSNITLSNNTVYNSGWGLFFGRHTHNSTMINNTGYNNLGDVQLWDAYYNNITENNFGKLSFYGIVLDNATANIFEKNNITEAEFHGISLYGSKENTFYQNNVDSGLGYAFSADGTSDSNLIHFNNFINNNPGFSQAIDDGTSNTFSHNYWSDQISPDNDNDKIVDNPYSVDGSASNLDYSPLTISSSSQFLLKPSILTPNTSGILERDVFISWTAAVNTWGFDVTYNVFYSTDGGSSWLPIILSLTETSYSWDTTNLSDGSNYKLKLESVSNGGLTVNVTYISTFTVDNTAPTVIINLPMEQIYTTSIVNIAFTGDAVHYWYYIDSVDTMNQSWVGDILLTLADGTYTLHAYGDDLSGNIYHTSVTFAIDTTAPIVTIVSPISQTYSTPIVNIAFTGDAVHYWYYIDSVDNINQTWTENVDRTLSDGTYTLHVYGNDTAGNIFHTSIVFTVDTPDPTTTSQTTPSTTTEPETKSEDTNDTGFLGFTILPGFAIMVILTYSYRISKRKHILN